MGERRGISPRTLAIICAAGLLGVASAVRTENSIFFETSPSPSLNTPEPSQIEDSGKVHILVDCSAGTHIGSGVFPLNVEEEVIFGSKLSDEFTEAIGIGRTETGFNINPKNISIQIHGDIFGGEIESSTGVNYGLGLAGSSDGQVFLEASAQCPPQQNINTQIS